MYQLRLLYSFAMPHVCREDNVRYYIKEHFKFKLRKPYKRSKGKARSAYYHTANERDDREAKVTVNVLIMAKQKKKNVTAGDLLGKLGRNKNNEKAAENIRDDEFVNDSEYIGDDEYDSIDVSSSSENDSSDSELDINELLRKYMPEYENGGASADDSDEFSSTTGGVLSRIKKSATDADVEEKDEDEKLIDALDSAFGAAAFSSDKSGDAIDKFFDEEFGDEFIGDEADADDEKRDNTITEYELDSETDEDKKDKLTEELFAEEPEKKKRGFFASLFGNSSKKAVEAKNISELEANNAEISDDAKLDDDLVEKSEAVDEIFAGEETSGVQLSVGDDLFEDADEVTAETADSDETEQTELNLVSDDDQTENESVHEELDSDIDPTDINLMVAFGLDGGADKKADKAKEFGDRLEAKQSSKTRKHKLDRPEYVDKTQTPKIRKEFADNQVKLWVKLGICAVFTVLLLIFENIMTLTNLFTGSPKQFAGVLDPAVYPVVYIMVSLQLMLLACICAFDEIVKGFKYILRGTPRPESMTSLLMVAGIIYSVVLSHIIKVPNEPVMFNFIVALSALLTLVYELFNNKREMMNFRIVANKKPKHIVRRLLDEESECESKAFADADDVCDVMKIEKADFVDGFFGRLSAPDSSTGIFMTFVMSVTVAIAILFGIFANFRGGDASMVVRVIYSAMLIIAPLSVYMTFSYPFYRANLVAKEYDSAIIGETSLEEYSNASIISFDDKNVFPSYSVKVQNIRIYNNARIDRVLYYAASAFAYAGGPLQDVFEVATKDMGTSNHVEIFDTETGFLATQVDGVNIIFGSCDALMARGLDIPASAAEDDVDLSDELEIMYMFRENKLVAKMYIQYVMDSDIDLILKQFSGSGLYVCVRTYDPNIDERMIARKLNMKRMPLKIVRYASTEEVGTYSEKVDSGLVTCGTPKSLLQVISYCGKVLHTKKTNIALSVLSVMIGVAILVLLLLSDSLGSLNSLFIALYQLIWLIPMMISSRMFIR